MSGDEDALKRLADVIAPCAVDGCSGPGTVQVGRLLFCPDHAVQTGDCPGDKN